MFDKNKIDRSWTIFLDRDGVINKKLIDDYVKHPGEFEFLEGVLESLKIFSKIFSHIFIVTNQRGIARDLMSEKDLEIIHNKMMRTINENGGKVDEIYYCPHDRDEECGCRKPDVGMAKKAKKEFPEINFERSIMVGDSVSDMQFGKELGMYNIFITTSQSIIPGEADMIFDSLFNFSKFLTGV